MKQVTFLPAAYLLAAALVATCTSSAAAPSDPVASTTAHAAVANATGAGAASKRGVITLKYEGEGKELLKMQAAEHGLEFHVLGPEPHVPLFVKVDQTNATFEDLLANVGAQFGDRANLVLTDSAVEVRYRAPAVKPMLVNEEVARAQPEPQQPPASAAVPIADTLSKGESLVSAQQATPLKTEVIAQAPKAEPLPPPPVNPAPQVWTLTAGHSVGQELSAWGKKAGWKVIWTMTTDWTVPAAASFTGEFKTAASDVIETLVTNGALIRAKFWDGNKTMVVTGPGVPEQ